MTTEPLQVDVWSDIACPFCYIGKRNFEAAVSASTIPVEVTFHSFLLAPDAPEESPADHATGLARKMGVDLAQARQMEARLTEAGAAAGLTFDYGRLQSTNTLGAHRLAHHARSHGRQAEMVERLMAAYFTEGRHLGRVDELADLAADIGLDRAEAHDVLSSGRYAQDVELDQRRAASYGIRGVPFFVIGGKYALSGAQEPAVFRDALAQASADRDPAA